MPLIIGTRLGPYEITGPLGAGGMGEVYRARDTRLDRDVAVKVLPSHLSQSPEVRARFEREARAISSLNHPHICTLHDVGQDSGVDYLVMELLEGESLAVRLSRGSLPLAELTRLGAQIADALDKAHRKGLVHRDLKPANVMITKGGAKLVDFGLARATGLAPSTGEQTSTPTMTSPLTAEGSIVGTFQYMAPEQLEGKETDARTDLWALGCVLYEMATGTRAFTGASQASLISSIMKDDPRPIGDLAPMSPSSLDRVVRQCLAKDPEERWQSAGDLKRELAWIAEGGSQASALRVSTAAPHRRMTPWLAGAAVVLLAGAMLALGYFLHAPAATRVMRANLELPRGTSLDTQDSSLALSPDGTRLAFIASGAGGQQQMWLRPMDSLVAQPLVGTEGATYPFWSPDAQYLGFFADRKLKKIPAGGGTVQTICEAADGRGASWSSEEGIVFAPVPFGPLFKVSASGGSPVAVTSVEAEGLSHRLPHFLPDGRRLLFVSATPGGKGNEIRVLDLGSKATSLVASADSEGLYVDPGYLIFVRDGNLMAQSIDARTLHLRGDAVPIAEKVRFNPYRFTGTYAFSGDGLLLYQDGAVAPNAQLTWFDLDGKKVATVGTPATFDPGQFLVIAPDGRTAAVAVRNDEGKLDLWTVDLERGVGSRLTFGSTPAGFPLWSPDGRRLIYGDGMGSLFIKAAGGSSEARTLISGAGSARLPSAWSPDGSVVIFWVQLGSTNWDLWVLPVTGDTKAYPLIETPANEQSAGFSPDGKWLSYLSDESGRQELFVVPFPGPGGKWQISSGGAVASWWIGDGREIYYVTPQSKVVAVEITAKGSDLQIGATRPLLGGRNLPPGPGAFTRDGGRYLAAVPVEEGGAPSLTLVTNWAAQIVAK